MTDQKYAVAVIGNQGFSMLNFRGTLIEDLVARGHKVYTLAPDFSPEVANAIISLGAEPVQIEMARTGTNPVADLRTMLTLRNVLVRIRPDVVLTYAAKPKIP